MAYTPNTNTVDTIASGNLTALNSTVVLNTSGVGTGIFGISGTWVGTITFEGSNNAFADSQAISAVYLGGIQTQSSTTTTNGFFSVITAGFAQVRAKMTAYTSGTAVILANGSAADRIVVPVQGNPNNHQVLATLNAGSAIAGKVGIDQTTPGTTNAVQANAGTNLNTSALALDSTVAKDATLTGGTARTKITDGTNNAAVKAASAAAVAADPAVVVAISPNNTVPVSLATNTPTLQSGSTTAVTQATGTNLHTVVDSGTITAVTAITNALPTGANVIGALTANQSINNAQVNGIALQTGTGVAGTGTQRVAVASDSSIVLATGAATIGALTANQSVNVSQINGITPLMGNGVTGTGSQRSTIASDNSAVPAWGLGATGAAVPTGAQYQGINPQTALPTAATAGNLTGITGDKFGRQVVLPNAMRDLMGTQMTTITSSTAETIIATAVAATFLDLVSIFITNTSATAVRVDIRDTTAGAVIFPLYIPAGDMRGLSLTTPWPQTAVNTNWTATCSASVADIRIAALYIKNK